MTLRPDVCVVGAGSAGLTVAAAAASFGLGVVLVEHGRMGGDCLNFGCVPSKALIAAARHAHAARSGAAFGVHAEPRVDPEAVAAHVRGVVAAIAPHDSVERFEGLGVTVLRETARFTGPGVLVAGGVEVRARRFVIATGSAPVVPQIPGLADCDPLTNETVFDRIADIVGRRLAIVGGGPIGCELAQAFARLGTRVTLVERGRILKKEDPDAVAVVRRSLLADGVVLVEDAGVERCGRDGAVTLTLSGGRTVAADVVLVATGRAPRTDGLGLDAAGVALENGAVGVDRSLRTSNRRVWAVGDCIGGLQFTHVAGHQASLVVRRLAFRLPGRYVPEAMPRTTYTAPELAQVGLTEEAARERDGGTTVALARLSGNDRAQTERCTDGFAKLVLSRRGRLVGATIVAPHAGEIAATAALALAGRVPVSVLARFVPPYPTTAEALKRAATAHFAERLDRPVVRALAAMLKRL